MTIFRNILFLTILGLVLSEEGTTYDPCNIDDIECINTAARKFLYNSANGVPKYDIKPISPMVIPSVDIFVLENFGVIYHFKNVSVDGMKNLKFNDYKLDRSNHLALVKTNVTLSIVSDVTIEFTKNSKTFSGNFRANLTTVGTLQYGYGLIKNENGIEYINIGTDTNICEIVGEPEVALDDNFLHTFRDTNVESYIQNPSNAEKAPTNLLEQVLCKIVDKAYGILMHNVRAATRVLPKTAFFNDI